MFGSAVSSSMNVFYPSCGGRLLLRMLVIAFIGGLVGGLYGVFHDQVTYSLSPEYFTRMKFEQFRTADFGYPERVFVAEIGFLASWWVGLLSAWFFARLAIPAWPPGLARRKIAEAFGIILLTAFSLGVLGYFVGGTDPGTSRYWKNICESVGVMDVRSFVRVGYIHFGSYIGGVVGLLAGLLYLLRAKSRHQSG
jgi:hypothetical protein